MLKKYKYDLLIVGVIFIIALASFLATMIPKWTDNGNNLHARIYNDNVLVLDVCLSTLTEDQEITIDGAESEITIHLSKSGVYVSHSGCKNQICVNTGKINYDGGVITCLPNKVYIEVVAI